MRYLQFFFLWVVFGTAACSQEYVETRGLLSDEDFYRLVACAAPPGGACRKDLVRWSPENAAHLTLGITKIDPVFSLSRAFQINAALNDAARKINALNAGVRFVGSEKRPDVSVLLLDMGQGEVIRNSGIPALDGHRAGAAYVRLWWNRNNEITRGAIVITRDLHPKAYASVVLEELVQSLGLLTDIANPSYRRTSIFSENGNDVTRLTGQDRFVIQRHYAPQNERRP